MSDSVSDFFYLYRLNSDGDGEIYGKFPSLMMAEMSAGLLLIKESCFILSGDMTKIYFYNHQNNEWEYDILTESGKDQFLDLYPNPSEYV